MLLLPPYYAYAFSVPSQPIAHGQQVTHINNGVQTLLQSPVSNARKQLYSSGIPAGNRRIPSALPMIPADMETTSSFLHIAHSAFIFSEQSIFSKMLSLIHFLYDCVVGTTAIGILNNIFLKEHMPMLADIETANLKAKANWNENNYNELYFCDHLYFCDPTAVVDDIAEHIIQPILDINELLIPRSGPIFEKSMIEDRTSAPKFECKESLQMMRARLMEYERSGSGSEINMNVFGDDQGQMGAAKPTFEYRSPKLDYILSLQKTVSLLQRRQNLDSSPLHKQVDSDLITDPVHMELEREVNILRNLCMPLLPPAREVPSPVFEYRSPKLDYILSLQKTAAFLHGQIDANAHNDQASNILANLQVKDRIEVEKIDHNNYLPLLPPAREVPTPMFEYRSPKLDYILSLQTTIDSLQRGSINNNACHEQTSKMSGLSDLKEYVRMENSHLFVKDQCAIHPPLLPPAKEVPTPVFEYRSPKVDCILSLQKTIDSLQSGSIQASKMPVPSDLKECIRMGNSHLFVKDQCTIYPPLLPPAREVPTLVFEYRSPKVDCILSLQKTIDSLQRKHIDNNDSHEQASKIPIHLNAQDHAGVGMKVKTHLFFKDQRVAYSPLQSSSEKVLETSFEHKRLSSFFLVNEQIEKEVNRMSKFENSNDIKIPYFLAIENIKSEVLVTNQHERADFIEIDDIPPLESKREATQELKELESEPQGVRDPPAFLTTEAVLFSPPVFLTVKDTDERNDIVANESDNSEFIEININEKVVQDRVSKKKKEEDKVVIQTKKEDPKVVEHVVDQGYWHKPDVRYNVKMNVYTA